MIHIASSLCRIAVYIVLLTAGSFVQAQSSNPGTPVFEKTSSGLITFGGPDRAIRVAAIFVAQDSAIVETVVAFVDAQGTVLKQEQANLRYGHPIVVELTRQDVGGQADVLVRVVVVHKLPGMRESGYPILVSMQPIATDGSGRSPRTWDVGRCGVLCGSPVGRGQHASCTPTFPPIF